jgi:hypothetical protein
VDLSDPNDFIDADDKVCSLAVGGVIGAGALFTFCLFTVCGILHCYFTSIKVNINVQKFLHLYDIIVLTRQVTCSIKIIGMNLEGCTCHWVRIMKILINSAPIQSLKFCTS